MWKKLKLFLGFDPRKSQWTVVAIRRVDKTKYNVKIGEAVVCLYRNGLGEERATASDTHDEWSVPLPYAKNLLDL